MEIIFDKKISTRSHKRILDIYLSLRDIGRPEVVEDLESILEIENLNQHPKYESWRPMTGRFRLFSTIRKAFESDVKSSINGEAEKHDKILDSFQRLLGESKKYNFLQLEVDSNIDTLKLNLKKIIYFESKFEIYQDMTFLSLQY